MKPGNPLCSNDFHSLRSMVLILAEEILLADKRSVDNIKFGLFYLRRGLFCIQRIAGMKLKTHKCLGQIRRWGRS